MAIAQKAPSWQNKLSSYSGNSNAGNAEVARAQQVYASKMASGDTAGANAAHSWANQIRNAMGVSSQYNSATGAAIQQPQQAPAQAQVQQPQFQQPDYTQQAQQQVNTMYDPVLQASLDRVRASKDSALGELNLQKQSVAPQYNDLKNQTDAVNAQNVQKLRENMAAQGLGQSGDNISGQVALSAQRGSDLNALNLQQQQRLNGIDQSIANVNNSNDEATITAQIGSEKAKAAMDLQQTLASQALQKQQMDSQATGYYNPYAGNALTPDIQQQLAPYSGDLQAFINANPDSPLVPFAQNARYQKIMSSQANQDKYGQQYQTVAAKTSSLQNQSQELDNKAKDIQNSYLPETLKKQAQLLTQQVRTGSLSYDTALAQLDQIKAQTSATNSGAETNAFNALTDATYKQGMLNNDSAKLGYDSAKLSSEALTTAKNNAMKYFDGLGQTSVNNISGTAVKTPFSDAYKGELKRAFNELYNGYLSDPNPYARFNAGRNIIKTQYPDSYSYLENALETALSSASPK